MDEKLARIQALKAERAKIEEEIDQLTAELTAEFDTALKGERKQRKPRAPKQLSLMK